MSLSAEKLYRLLPAIHRIRDAAMGGSLEALINVIAAQADVLEEDIQGLYENWFIETCDEWVVPYIGDLLGVRGLHPIHTAAGISQRAFVANTIQYRRRKGTATVLEQLAFDITGWRARAVEFFERIASTQHYQHIRPHNERTPDLRRSDLWELLDSAFDTAPHTVDVRNITSGRGRHNIPNIGIFLWRLQSYFMSQSMAHPVADPADGRYTFDPLRGDTPLFNRPQTEATISSLAEEINVPGYLRRRALHDDLETLRQALIDGRTPRSLYFGTRPVLQVSTRANAAAPLTAIPPEEMVICDLAAPQPAIPEGWRRPSTQKGYQPLAGGPLQHHPISVAIDPVRGRLAFPPGVLPGEVRVSYAYGFSGDIGGGPYDRRESLEAIVGGNIDWQRVVSRSIPSIPGEVADTLDQAIGDWNAQPAGTRGVIAVADNASWDQALPVIEIPERSQLVILAAQWPEVQDPAGPPGAMARLPGNLDPRERRPHIESDVSIRGLAPEESAVPGSLVLDGLLIEGRMSIEDGNLGRLRIADCTLVPAKGGLHISSGNQRLSVDLVRTICGPVSVDTGINQFSTQECIIDPAGGGSGGAIQAVTTPVVLQKTTVLGTVDCLGLEAGNCIFNALVEARRRQQGCVRFSYLPLDSMTPRCFRCQPHYEIGRQIEAAEKQGPVSNLARLKIRKGVLDWLFPSFTSTRYGHPAYAQLHRHCPAVIKTGADDGSEMGVFNHLKQPQRESNFKVALEAYVRFGMQTGMIYVT
ncbi:MAG: hypothetical protein PVF97_00050 [Desulfobacterales bacterium]|jgi:hypothetical protein